MIDWFFKAFSITLVSHSNILDDTHKSPHLSCFIIWTFATFSTRLITQHRKTPLISTTWTWKQQYQQIYRIKNENIKEKGFLVIENSNVCILNMHYINLFTPKCNIVFIHILSRFIFTGLCIMRHNYFLLISPKISFSLIII